MNIVLDWKVCIGICFIVIFVSYLFTGGGVQKYIGMKPLEPGVDTAKYQEEIDLVNKLHGIERERGEKDDFVQRDFRYYQEEKQRRKEQERRRREEKKRDEEWKRKHFKRREYEDEYDKQRPIRGEPIKVNMMEKKEKKAKPIVQWGKPDKSEGEKQCAQILANLTDKEFETIRSPDLINPETGQMMEIDVYNDELKLGLEYNGPQHYEFPNWTNCSYDEFRKQIARDEIKRMKCQENGIKLIEVPYTVKEVELYDYILDKMIKLGYKFQEEDEKSEGFQEEDKPKVAE